MTTRVVVCDKCGNKIPVSPSENEAILAQIREEVRQEAQEEQDAAIQIAVDAALAKARVAFCQQETKAAQDRAASEKAVEELKHKLDLAEQGKETAVQQAVAEAEAEKARLSAALHHSEEASEMRIKAAVAEAAEKIHDLEEKHLRDKAQVKAEAADEIAKRDLQIASMIEKAKAANTEKEFAVKSVQDKMIAELQKKETEIQMVKRELETRIQAAQLQGNMEKEKYEAALRLKDEEIRQVKEFKAKLSTKALGESLEKYCEDQFNAIRTTAFPNAYFEKDNDAKSGSKGDYIYREKVGDTEIMSIMFDMKTEAETTVTKKRNEDYFKELDKDRNEKKCEYAVLVSTLEADSDYYNAGIQDVSYRYKKMYVVRPSQFITIISLLRNAALNSVEYQKELALVKSQQLDLTNFEANMTAFKEAFSKNYLNASAKLTTAVEGIDKTIANLQKIKDALLSSDRQLRLASVKAEDLSIRRLTKGAPSVAAKLAAVKAGESSDADETTASATGDKDHTDVGEPKDKPA